MQIRLLRLQKGWSQEQLAELAGLSTRTIQRIERGAKASPETLKCIASVLETRFDTLQEIDEMPVTNPSAETDAIEYVRDIKSFYNHLITFVVVNLFLIILNLFVTPGYFWALWSILGWGIGVALHAVNTFEVVSILGPEWERRQIEKRINKS